MRKQNDYQFYTKYVKSKVQTAISIFSELISFHLACPFYVYLCDSAFVIFLYFEFPNYTSSLYI